ncbi:hypothetical protein [Saccharibacillus sp. JS10]|uniref:hypothetical protein n=1 Tax=Saccharibacillus sp. JS10 TaxID=2950552 RepID=UPI00210BB2B9|nr:hypothetical protein [Saccharibacillus sp. JS10]MCQ4085860.1 hypothetical protein [Saccharibacillus sp. JS10]
MPLEQTVPLITKTERIDVQLTVTEELNEENKLQISGETNLPDGMELMLTVKNDNGYSAQDKVAIQSGEFTSGWFSQNGSSLSGDYAVKVTSPTANVQPIEVQQVIGENGIHLYGDQVKKDNVWGNMIEFKKQINIPSITSDVEKQNSAVRNQINPPSIDIELWNKIDTAFDNGEFNIVKEIVEEVLNPDEELLAVYHYSLYHYYGQGGEDDKSQEFLNMIPLDYSGKHAESIAYTRYQNEHYQDENYESISLEEFVEEHYNPSVKIEELPTKEIPRSTYTKEELQNDPLAPSTDPRDDNSNSEYVPHDGPSSNPTDYDFNGNYRPTDEMTQTEIQAELESMLDRSIGK